MRAELNLSFTTAKSRAKKSNKPPPPVALATVRSKAVVLWLCIHCLLLLPLFVGVWC